MDQPAISVLMPVFNGLPYLRETLDSLLGQTLQDFELVAVEDGSTDGSLAVLEEYASRDGRVVIVRNEENQGLPRSLNRGLERCRAPLVARADADDTYAPDRLERQVRFLDRHPEVGLLSCAVHKTDAEGRRFTTTYFPTEDGQIRLRELFVNCFSHPGVVFRTDLVRAVGGYDPDYWTSEDADLWARLRDHTRAANLDVPLVYYRKHGTSMMRTRGSEGEALSLSVRQRLLSDYLGRSVDLDETRSLVTTFWARPKRPATPAEAEVGRRGLREILRRAEARETPETVLYFRGEVGEALLKQASFVAGADRALGRALLVDAVRWSPRLGLTRDAAKQAVRSALPGGLVTAIRRIAGGNS